MMAADKSLFAPIPLRAMAAELSGLQWSALACICAHDRLSLVTGKGQGCRASNERMREMIGCSYARLCSTLTELVDLGYLQREKLGRHTVYRVIYSDADRLLFSNVSSATARSNRLPSRGVTGCQHTPETAANLPETASQYIPLNGGIDLEESREDNSSEEARLASRLLSKKEKAFNLGGELSRFERVFRTNPSDLDLPAWRQFLEDIADNSDSNADLFRAQRLLEDVDWWLEETGQSHLIAGGAS
jgi:hypothetical protein